jgi:hypothetical protein
MPNTLNSNDPMAHRVYRLRLLEGIYREISFRSSAYSNGHASNGAGCEIDDMLRLKDALPLLKSEEQAERIGKQIQAVLANCESQLVREIPPGNIAHFMRMAHRQSLRPYCPTDDELVLEA